MRTANTIYLSDILAVPCPRQTASGRDYLRRKQTRRSLWEILPALLEAVCILSVLLFIVGIALCVVGLTI